MKRKDDLLNLAFGELSDEAAKAVESRADASDRREIESFRELRSALQHLPSPPPDNLSPERLRAAILDRELAARRPDRSFGWGWAPLVVGALAIIALAPRFGARPEPTIVSLRDEPLSLQNEKPKLLFGTNDAFTRPVATPSRPAVVQETRSRRSQETDFVSRPVRHHRRSVEDDGPTNGLYAMNTTSNPGTEGEATPPIAVATNKEPQTIATPPSSVTLPAAQNVPAPMDNASKPATTVVLISSKRDLETGALAATETEASGVAVGG